mmetsp:Transcript_2623/g.6164  ORF Transcript_2623/g.6164 Transcript_2623/m.6164 type:complete len:244 (-) Transcript_2623:157-888(-)
MLRNQLLDDGDIGSCSAQISTHYCAHLKNPTVSSPFPCAQLFTAAYWPSFTIDGASAGFAPLYRSQVHPCATQLLVSANSGAASWPEEYSWGERMSMLPSAAQALTKATASSGASHWYGALWLVVTATFRPPCLRAAKALAKAGTMVELGPETSSTSNITPSYPACLILSADPSMAVSAAAVNTPALLPPPKVMYLVPTRAGQHQLAPSEYWAMAWSTSINPVKAHPALAPAGPLDPAPQFQL